MEIVIKNICASCSKDFENSLAKYETNGNYCQDCSSKINHLMEIKRKLDNPEKNKDRIKALLKILKKWNIGLDYVLASKSQIDEIRNILKGRQTKE